MKNLINLSNSLSVLRVVLLYPFLYFYTEYKNGINSYLSITLVITFIMILSDYLDGYFARKWGQITELGKILDPIADKLAIVGVAIVLNIKSDLPDWILIVIISRDILILLGASFLAKRIKSIPSSEWPGKITAFIMAVLLVSYIVDFNSAKFILLILTAISITYSFLDYLFKFIKLLEKERS